MKYRKKPVEVEAMRVGEILLYAEHNWEKLPQWIIDAYEGRTKGVKTLVFTPKNIHISTPAEGVMLADYADWLIQGVEGELYPCKASIFKVTYEPVEAKQPTASDHELQSVEDGGAKKLYPPEEYNHIKD